MEAILIEKAINQLLHLLTTNPDLQKTLMEHYAMTIQHLGVSVPSDAAEAFLKGIKHLSDATWMAGWEHALPVVGCAETTCCTVQ